MSKIGDWGHEYIRQLESEIISQWLVCPNSTQLLLPLVKDIIKFDCKFHAEIQACDLLMEIDQLELLPKVLDKTIYQRTCHYLFSCTKFVDETESAKILDVVTKQYIRFNEYPRALMLAMHMRRPDVVHNIFSTCKDLYVNIVCRVFNICFLFFKDHASSTGFYGSSATVCVRNSSGRRNQRRLTGYNKQQPLEFIFPDFRKRSTRTKYFKYLT